MKILSLVTIFLLISNLYPQAKKTDNLLNNYKTKMNQLFSSYLMDSRNYDDSLLRVYDTNIQIYKSNYSKTIDSIKTKISDSVSVGMLLKEQNNFDYKISKIRNEYDSLSGFYTFNCSKSYFEILQSEGEFKGCKSEKDYQKKFESITRMFSDARTRCIKSSESLLKTFNEKLQKIYSDQISKVMIYLK